MSIQGPDKEMRGLYDPIVGPEGPRGVSDSMKVINLCSAKGSKEYAFERRIDGVALRFHNGIKVFVEISECTGYCVVKIMFLYNRTWQDITTEIIGEDHLFRNVEEFLVVVSQLKNCFLDDEDLHVPKINRGQQGCIGPTGEKGVQGTQAIFIAPKGVRGEKGTPHPKGAGD